MAFVARHPDHRKCARYIGSVIVIEGEIGVGKTTLGRSIETYLQSIGLRCRFFPERVDYELLNLFINDKHRYSFAFQIAMLKNREQVYREAEEFSRSGGISIVDRSLAGDMTFARMLMNSGHISADEFEVYMKISKEMNLLMPTITLYLESSIDTLLDRVNTRGIAIEKKYDRQYLTELKHEYEKTFENSKNLLRFDWSQPKPLSGDLLSDVEVKTLFDKIASELF
jgi:deoxyadenosine/deoxycytidine kinase